MTTNNMLIGWLSPNGVFYECDYWNHIDLAYSLLNDLAIEPKNDNTPDEELIQRGWIKLYISLFHPAQLMYYNYDRPIATEAQREFLLTNYIDNPENWDICGIRDLKDLGVLEEEYDEHDFLL